MNKIKSLLSSATSKYWPLVLLTTASFLIWSVSIGYDFFILDDDFHLFDHTHLKRPSWASILRFWRYSLMATVYTVWGGMRMVFGRGDAYAFHFVNVTFHTANTLLFYLFIRRLYPKLNTIVIVLACLFFCFHPTKVEAVVWISSLKHLMAAFFGLSFLLLYLKYSALEDKRYWPIYFLLILAITSHPGVISLLPMVFILDIFHFKKTKSELVTKFIVFVGLIVAVVSFMILALYQKNLDQNVRLWSLDLNGTTFWSGFVALGLYWQKLLLVGENSLDYGYYAQYLYGMLKGLALGKLSFVLGLFIVIIPWPFLWKRKRVGYVLLFFFLAIYPYIGHFRYPFGDITIIADRYMYWPSLFFILMLLEFHLLIKTRLAKVLALAVVSFFCLYSGLRTWSLIKKWENPHHILSHSLNVNPRSFFIHTIKAYQYEKEKNHFMAIYHHKQAYEVNKLSSDARKNLKRLIDMAKKDKRYESHWVPLFKAMGIEITY